MAPRASNAIKVKLRLTLDQPEKLAVEGLVCGHNSPAFDSGWSAVPLGDLAAGLQSHPQQIDRRPSVEPMRQSWLLTVLFFVWYKLIGCPLCPALEGEKSTSAG